MIKDQQIFNIIVDAMERLRICISPENIRSAVWLVREEYQKPFETMLGKVEVPFEEQVESILAKHFQRGKKNKEEGYHA